MKRALVCGAGGFIGGHPSTELRAGLVKKLKGEGYWVRGVDIKERQSRGPGTGHEFAPTVADEFLLLDLREPKNCKTALTLGDGTFDEVYQLAAHMGGMGFIGMVHPVVIGAESFEIVPIASRALQGRISAQTWPR